MRARPVRRGQRPACRYDYVGVVGQGAQSVAAALAHNAVLAELDLHSNAIGDVGARAFAKALYKNSVRCSGEA